MAENVPGQRNSTGEPKRDKRQEERMQPVSNEPATKHRDDKEEGSPSPSQPLRQEGIEGRAE